MIEPKLTELAEADLDAVWDRIAVNHPIAADRMVEAVLESSRLHVRFPSMGQNREELSPGLRCFGVAPYVVFYRSVEGTIEILRILHGARDIGSFLPDEP
jgi:toxin ParE1/3/4